MTCEIINSFRSETIAQHIVKEKVVQFIRADQILGFLLDVALFVCRNQFRTYWCIDYVEQQ